MFEIQTIEVIIFKSNFLEPFWLYCRSMWCKK